jgi:uncharacterized protein (UPF0335 family)
LSEYWVNSLVNECLSLINSASDKGLPLRAMGGIGIRLQVEKCANLYRRFERKPNDIDLISRRKYSKMIEELLMKLGYRPDERFNLYHGNIRQIWYGNEHQVDIFFDRLEMCHTIDVRKRIEIDRPALNVSDLLLSKLQIVRINEKDIVDSAMLLLEHDIKEGKGLDINYICNLLSNDWGFYHTVQLNLTKIKEFVSKENRLDDEEKKVLSDKIDKIQQSLQKSGKTLRWKLRSIIGERKKWYNEVEEVIR